MLTRCALSLLVSKTAAKNDEILTSVLVMYAAYGVNTLLYGSIMKDIPTEVAMVSLDCSIERFRVAEEVKGYRGRGEKKMTHIVQIYHLASSLHSVMLWRYYYIVIAVY